MSKLKLVIGLLLVVACINNASATDLDSVVWQDMVEDYEYAPPVDVASDTTPIPEPDKDVKIEPPRKRVDLSPLQILLYIGIAVAFIALVVILVRTGVIEFGDKKVELKLEHDAENPDELVLTELERELALAAQDGNYNRCLRYEFLLLLERLQEKGKITWHKYKTNGEYLNQLLALPYYKRVRQLTLVYEYYWYGEHSLNERNYQRLVGHFEQLKAVLENG
ncbi:MAG: DUF4129 domain-containing protein [Bacteroidia bacterium]|nr:DUF4129 domain-containing protein [Bacteroidia bacterium]